MARFGKILLYSLGVVFLLVLEVSFPERSDRKHPPRLHADEAVQWSLAKDAAGGVPYSINEDKFHGPALAVATRGVFAARGLAFDDATVADLRRIPFYFFVLLCAVPLLPARGVLLSRLPRYTSCVEFPARSTATSQ